MDSTSLTPLVPHFFFKVSEHLESQENQTHPFVILLKSLFALRGHYIGGLRYASSNSFVLRRVVLKSSSAIFAEISVEVLCPRTLARREPVLSFLPGMLRHLHR